MLRWGGQPRPWENPPGDPGRPGPGWRPGVPVPPHGGEVAGWLQEKLYDQRIVLLSGPVDLGAANRTVAALLSLDVLAAEPVQIHLNSPDGDLTAVFGIIDTIDGMRSPVHVVVTVQAGGGALGVLAAAGRRTAYPHARFRLAEPAVADLSGTADEVAAAAGRHLRELEELILRLASACDKPRSRVEDDLGSGLVLSAGQALDYGLIEEIGPLTAG